jgi:hypothetical protein
MVNYICGDFEVTCGFIWPIVIKYNFYVFCIN